MTNTITKTEALIPAPVKVLRDKFDQADVIAAIKQTVAKGATDAQLKMFIEVCRTTGLNPWLKEIWYVAEKGIIMAGRDGYLRVANENPQFDGMETRVERDDRNVPVKAVCTVWRKDRGHPIICEAYFSEYNKQSPVWRQYPSAMIQKVAEVLALKRSFAINGVVSEEEVGEGSRAEQQQVAESKIARMEAGETYVQVSGTEGALYVDAAPPEQFSQEIEAPPEPSRQIHDDIVAFPPKEPRRPNKSVRSRHIDMLQAFQVQKKRFQNLGREDTYYTILGRYGAEKSNEFPSTDEGLKSGLSCYREMQITLGDLEAKAATIPAEVVQQ